MKVKQLAAVAFFGLLGLIAQRALAENLTSNVNAFMGVTGAGNTVLGPQLPWGSAHPSPDTEDGNTTGYNSKKKIRGFSQLHVTGTGGPGKYGQFLISPQIGLNVSEGGHDSAKSDEIASVSAYQVRLTDYNVFCEVSPTRHASIYRFTFPKSDDAHIVFDSGHTIPRNSNWSGAGYADDGEIKVDGTNQLVCGWGNYWGGWSAEPFRVYFALKFSRPATEFGTWKGEKVTKGSGYERITGKDERIGAYIGLKTQQNEPVLVKIAISFSSIEKAKQYLEQEIPGWNYDSVKAQAEATWNAQFSKIRLEGSSPDQTKIFYSCLYNTMRMPRDRTGDTGDWQTDQPYWDDHYCVWDTWRTVFPLQVLLNESMVRDNVRAFLDRYEHNGQALDAFIAGNDRYYEWPGNNRCDWLQNQGGDDVGNVIVDAYVKKVGGIDWKTAYKFLKNSAEAERAPSYRINDRGWVPYRKYAFGLYCSRSLEFSYNDFCLAEMAKGLGQKADYRRFLGRSRQWEKLWNTNATSEGWSGFISPRRMEGAWVDCDPKSDQAKGGAGGIDRCFYEGTGWIYSYFVPHDFARLIELSGGAAAYCDRLQFALQHGLIDFGNEPSFLTPYSFIYASRPDLTAYWVRRNMANYKADSFPGDEDSGAMSSWYVFAALGFFPNAGQDLYFLSGPLFPKATLQMENGKTMVIEAVNASPENIYVQSLTLNGKPYDKAWIRHDALSNNAVLRFVMGSKPSDWGTKIPPPSLK